MRFGEWKSDASNSLFSYSFSKEGVMQNHVGHFIIVIDLLSKQYVENFTYELVPPMITEKSHNEIRFRDNPKFDPIRDTRYIPMKGLLIPDLLKDF